MKLNIGSGNRYKKDYLNLDIDKNCQVDIIADALRLPFKNCVFDEVYSRAVLEHISWRKTFDTLWEWRRVLKFGGKLVILVPDWDWIRKQNKIAYEIVPWLFGGQRDAYDFHKSLFDELTLLMFYKQIGISEIKIEKQGYYIKIEGIKAGVVN